MLNLEDVPRDQECVCVAEAAKAGKTKLRGIDYVAVPLIIETGVDKGCRVFDTFYNASDLRHLGLPWKEEDLSKSAGLRFKVKISRVGLCSRVFAQAKIISSL